jgi:hypothetical protein
MNVLKLQRFVDEICCFDHDTNGQHPHLRYSRKFPQLKQDELFALAEAFRKLDVDDVGYINEATAIKATQQSEKLPYDFVRSALKGVDLDSSRRVELEDYVGVRRCAKAQRSGTILLR